MPRMEDEALEDLAEQLHGCLEGSEGTLHFRGLEVARLAEGRLVRSFSDSFLAIGGDLDRLGSLASGEHVSEVRESLMRTNSAIGLAGEDWGPALGSPRAVPCYHCSLSQDFYEQGMRGCQDD